MRFTTVLTLAALAACSSTKPPSATGDGGAVATCSPLVQVASTDYCKSCTQSNGATCQNYRPLDACCVWVGEPRQEAARATGLHYFSSSTGDTTVDLGCLANPATVGQSKLVTLKGFVKLFSTGNDSAGVKIEIFKESPSGGALGDPVGTPFVTTGDDTQDPPQLPLPTWSSKCPAGGCKLRSYSYANVPTETPLIIKTSDATGSGDNWSVLYDYNIFIPNSAVDAASNSATHDASAVAATDVNTVAAAAGGFTIKPDKGVLAGEVHDCGDIRISGAMVDTDVPHEGEMFYFSENESDPLPDKTRAAANMGTSKLGLFGALNLPTGTPARISAVIRNNGQDVLIGTYVVQLFPGAITALSLRGRRPQVVP